MSADLCVHWLYSYILTRTEGLLHLDGTERRFGQRRKASQTKIVKGDPQERSHGEHAPEKHTDQTDVQTAVCRAGSTDRKCLWSWHRKREKLPHEKVFHTQTAHMTVKAIFFLISFTLQKEELCTSWAVMCVWCVLLKQEGPLMSVKSLVVDARSSVELRKRY